MNAADTGYRDARSTPIPIAYSIDRIIVLCIVVLLAWRTYASIRYGSSYLAWLPVYVIVALTFYAGRLSGQRQRMGDASSS